MGRKAKPALDRFLAKVIKTRCCWEWTGAKNRSGYGQFTASSHHCMRAHRFSFEVFKGPIPDKMCVCHLCDNPGCVNPEHLFLGTYKDNILDAINKGRFRKPWDYKVTK